MGPRGYFLQWEKISNREEGRHLRLEGLLVVDRPVEDRPVEDHPVEVHRRRHQLKKFWNRAWMLPLTYCMWEMTLDSRTRAKICESCGPG